VRRNCGGEKKLSFLDTVKAAGIVGQGGAGFPTHVKLNTNKAEYYIVNAAECEPLIETDKFLMRTRADDLVRGVDLIAKELGATKKYIALKAAYKREIALLESAIARAGSDIRLHKMNYFYPAGDEQVIVCQITGKSVPERGIPIACGAVVDNVGTILSVLDAVEQDRAVFDKYLSVVGEVEKPVMLHVPIGISVRECVEAAHPTIKGYGVIMGGPMMGKTVTDDAEIDKLVITKTDGNIIVLPKDHYLFRRAALKPLSMKNQTRSTCIQCKMCTDMCPRFQTGHNMRPNLVMRNLWRVDSNMSDDEFVRAFGDAANCSECGICEMFACPMLLSPRKANIYVKTLLRERGIDVPKLQNPIPRETMDLREVPTDRLAARLELGKYYGRHLASDYAIDLSPDVVSIPLKMHIGAPATACVAVGDKVEAGAPIAQIDEGKLGANIHASVGGTVESVSDKIVIRRDQ